MNGFVQSSAYFGVVLTFVSYAIGVFLNKKTKCALVNPILVSVVLVIAVLVIARIDYDAYYESAKVISFFLTPTTVCLAVPLYEKLHLLRHNAIAILVGILSGVLASLVSIFVMAELFNFSHTEYVTFLPKSITTAIGIGVSEELGGMVTLTAAVIIVTGMTGNILAPFLLRLIRVTDPIARGIAIGTASHAIGTSRAIEMGEVEGAMSGLAIAVAGLITVVGASLFAELL